jgi:hypothetical protein
MTRAMARRNAAPASPPAPSLPGATQHGVNLQPGRIIEGVTVMRAVYSPNCSSGGGGGGSGSCSGGLSTPPAGENSALPPPWRMTLSDGDSLDCDLVILATGTAVDVASNPLFQELLAACPPPAPLAGGLPVLDSDLRWAPGVPLHCMGVLAALQLGPDALNLAGAVGGARRLYPLLREALYGPDESNTAEESETEEVEAEVAQPAASAAGEVVVGFALPRSHGGSGGQTAAARDVTPKRRTTGTTPRAHCDCAHGGSISRLLGGDGNAFSALALDSDSELD